MALNNIIAKRDQLENSQGQPLGGAFIFLYEPGTTTFIQSFRDSGLVTPNSAPVRTSGSGRASIWINRDCDLRIEDRNGNLILTEKNVNPDDLSSGDVGGLLANGGFEIDTDLDGTPDSWVLVNQAGSNNARDTSESTEGAASFRFTSSGPGGGSLTSENFFPVNDVDPLRVSFDMRSTVAAVRNIVRVEWYDVSQISISNTDGYDSVANPVTYTSFFFDAVPPALARFAKVRLIGIDPSVALAGSTYFDNTAAFYPAIVSGIFDNIEIRNNEIISTNTNGEIDLKPNGTGPVNLISSNAVDLADINNPMNVGQLVGPGTNPHIAFDDAAIQAKADATNAAAISINPLGGAVNIAIAGTDTNILGDLVVGDGSSAVPGITIDSTIAGDPRIDLTQAGTLKAFMQYMDAGDILAIDSDGTIILATANTAALSIDTSQNTTLSASLYLAEVAASADVANFGQLFVNVSNELIYRDEAGTELNLSAAGAGVPGGADTNVQFNNAGAFDGDANFTFDGSRVRIDSDLTNSQALYLQTTVASRTSPLLELFQGSGTGNGDTIAIDNRSSAGNGINSSITGDGDAIRGSAGGNAGTAIRGIASNNSAFAGLFTSGAAGRQAEIVSINGTTSTSGLPPVLKIESAGRGAHIELDGLVGNDGGGIQFTHQVRSTDPNTLDWYQEGGFTAYLDDSPSGDGQSDGQTYGLHAGRFTRIGRLVFYQLRLTMTSIGTLAGNAYIVFDGTLPNNAGTSDPNPCSIADCSNLAITAGTSVAGSYLGLSGAIELFTYDLATGTSPMQISEISANGEMYVSGFYEVLLG